MVRLSLLARVSIALALVALVPLAYAVWSLFDVNRRGMHEQVLRTHAVAASTAAARIASVVETRRALARSVAANASDPSSEASRAFLQELLAADASIEILDVVTPAGEVVIRARRRGASERAGAIPQYAPAVWNDLLLVTEPLADARGDVRLITNADGIRDALDPAEIGDQAQIVLASRDGTLVQGRAEARPTFPPAMLAAAHNARVNGTGVYRDANDREILGAFAPVAGTPWFVLSRQPSSLAQNIAIAMRRRAMIAAGVAVALALLLVVAAHRSVIRPIREVIRAQHELAGHTPLPKGSEIEQLRATAASIQRRIADQEDLGRIFLGRYQVLGVIGQGGMGTVFRGWDPKLRRHVALKTVHLAAMAGKDAANLVESLISEAITAASVPHPNIVSVFDVEDSTSVAFIAMELIDGVSLQSYLDQRSMMPADQVVLLGLAVARALEAAHGRDVMHHDIKPANVLLGFDGAIKVADFGLAALINSTASHDEVFGTPGYIAPEAATGMGHDVRTDLFALGVVLSQAVTGSNPFDRDTARETMISSVMLTPPPLVERIVGGDELVALSGIVESLMAKKPGARPQTAAEVALRLERVVQRHHLQWKLDVAKPGAPLHIGHGSAGLVPTIAIRTTLVETQPR